MGQQRKNGTLNWISVQLMVWYNDFLSDFYARKLVFHLNFICSTAMNSWWVHCLFACTYKLVAILTDMYNINAISVSTKRTHSVLYL